MKEELIGREKKNTDINKGNLSTLPLTDNLWSSRRSENDVVEN